MIFALILVFNTNINAQENPMLKPIPNDAAWRIGTLGNGMTYYIKKNSKPANSANFHIVTHIGAVNEEDRQNGLAHFLEHMAFNGIEIFPNEKMLEYLQNNGIEFGRNINASTGLDVTQYFLQDIPLNKSEGLVDTALLILRDWSSNILLQKEEIDAERGVIKSELRQTETGARKLMMNRFNNAGTGTNYAKRNVIGTIDILDNFTYEDIKDFYKTWYRPSLQAVVIVGDFDLDKMEEKVKALYSKIPAKENEKVKEQVNVPIYPATFAKVFVDKQLTGIDFWALSQINIEKIETNNQFGSFIRRYMFDIVNNVFNKRLEKIAQNADSPIIYGVHMNNSFLENNEFGAAISGIKKGREADGIELIGTEINRMKKFGINTSELKLAIQEIAKSEETSYNNRNDETNTQHAFKAVGNFTTNIPIFDPEMKYGASKQILPTLTKDMVNQFVPMLFSGKNYFLSVGAPETTITETQIVEAFTKGLNAEVTALEERKIDSNILDAATLTKGEITSTEDGLYDSKIWTLSNGAKVIFKKTELKKDEMLFSARKAGGMSVFSDDKFLNAAMGNIYPTSGMSGVSKYSYLDLGDALAGKKARVGISVNDYFTTLSGNSSSTDVETLFKLINLNMTQPRFEQSELDAFLGQITPMLSNWKNDPNQVFNNNKTIAESTNKLRASDMETASKNIDKMSIENSKMLFNEAIAGVDGMTFIFVGNAEVEKMKEYAELYIGSIPAGTKTVAIDREKAPVASVDEFIFEQKDNKASVYESLVIDGKYDYREDLVYGILSDILNYKYTEVIREKMGATYGVRATINGRRTPDTFRRTFNASYSTNDDKVRSSAAEIKNQISIIAKNGVDKEDFIKSIENRKKNYINNQIHNGLWLSNLSSAYNSDMEMFNSFDKAINSITDKDIQKAAKNLLKNGVEIDVTMSTKKL